MNIHQRLHTQWTEAAQDWIAADQAVRTGMLDRWMLDSLGDVTGKSAIDIGCGEGRFSRLLSQLGATVTGVDLTEPLIERARSLSTGETYLLGNAENLQGIESNTYDIAVSYIVLVDLQDYRSAINAAYPRPPPRRSLRRLQHPPHAKLAPRRLDQAGRHQALLPRGQLHRGRTPRI